MAAPSTSVSATKATSRTLTANASKNATRILAKAILVATTTTVSQSARATSASAKLATAATTANLTTNATRTTTSTANLARSAIMVSVCSRGDITSTLMEIASKNTTSVFS